MAHFICCPHLRRPRNLASPPLPCRPPPQMDSVLALSLLPEDHPHGRRFHFSPVGLGILKSPRVTDKIKLKMSRKSSRTLRKELDRLADAPYDGDAHALTSTEVVDAAAGARFLGGDGARDIEFEQQRKGSPSRTPLRFGTTSGEATPVRRETIQSPSIYSRSQSRCDDDAEPRPPEGPMGGRRLLAGQDFLGLYYRLILPRRPSILTVDHSSRPQSMQLSGTDSMQISRVHSQHWSDSVEGNTRRRLEQSGAEECPESNGLLSNAAEGENAAREDVVGQDSHRSE